MPEGDTLHKVAAAMRPLLVGQRLVSARLAQAPAALLAGRLVRAVEAYGKHLKVTFAAAADDSGWVLRVHLGMTGSWHAYRPQEPWRRPRRLAQVVLCAPAVHLVCFTPKDVELWAEGRASLSRQLEQLGPDLLRGPVDFDRVLARAARQPADAWVVDVLLDQRVAAGIGNVYKSELMFMHQVAPNARLGDLPGPVLLGMYQSAALWLRRNLGDHRRTTTYDRSRGPGRTPAQRLWVYGRRDDPCRRCQHQVAAARWGRQRRSTYWCPSCQRPQQALSQPFCAS